ncbi:hypothetical protein JXB11_02815 [Candidatus Woesearchaeota archaeon]|nr:hypothetical protein [Candidatus Woesearchaeota archaeon]
MGKLIGYRPLKSGKIKCFLSTDVSESSQLEGNMRGVYLFCPGTCKTKSGVIEVGINHSTKYFEVPEALIFKPRRKKISKKKLFGTCQKLEKKDKVFFIYIVMKRALGE